MKKPLIAMLSIGLVAATLVGPAEAKKKKPKKPPVSAPAQVDQKYFLVNANESGCAAEGMLLMLAALETGGGCGSYFGGPVNAAFSQATGAPCSPATPVGSTCGAITHTAGEGLPVSLDATKKITGTIEVASYRGVSSVNGVENPAALAAGPTPFHMNVSGTVDGELKALGHFTSNYTVTPDKRLYEIPFEIALDPSVDKAELTTLSVDFWNTGAAALHGFYNANTSFVVLPTWKTL